MFWAATRWTKSFCSMAQIPPKSCRLPVKAWTSASHHAHASVLVRIWRKTQERWTSTSNPKSSFGATMSYTPSSISEAEDTQAEPSTSLFVGRALEWWPDPVMDNGHWMDIQYGLRQSSGRDRENLSLRLRHGQNSDITARLWKQLLQKRWVLCLQDPPW